MTFSFHLPKLSWLYRITFKFEINLNALLSTEKTMQSCSFLASKCACSSSNSSTYIFYFWAISFWFTVFLPTWIRFIIPWSYFFVWYHLQLLCLGLVFAAAVWKAPDKNRLWVKPNKASSIQWSPWRWSLQCGCIGIYEFFISSLYPCVCDTHLW